jgi:predicted metal-dependent phosphoesterase TrpH
MNVDLHMHTHCSDGVYEPEQLAQMAVDAGLAVISITDHDTVAAYDGSHHFPASLRIIPGIELSSDYGGEDIHVLGYYIDPHHEAIQSYSKQFRQRRLKRAMQMVDKCISLGYVVDKNQIEALLQKGGTVGRPHLAKMMVERGYYPDIKTVFDKLLYRGGPAYIPYHRYTVDQCIDLIHQAGGIAFLAHPGMIKQKLDPILQFQFDGVEVYHPENRGHFDEFSRLAVQKHWLVSGGSDYHGVPKRYPEQVGVFCVDADNVRELLQYRD